MKWTGNERCVEGKLCFQYEMSFQYGESVWKLVSRVFLVWWEKRAKRKHGGNENCMMKKSGSLY